MSVGAQILEGTGEGVGKRPDRPGLKLLVLRLEVVGVDGAKQADGKLALSQRPKQ